MSKNTPSSSRTKCEQAGIALAQHRAALVEAINALNLARTKKEWAKGMVEVRVRTRTVLDAMVALSDAETVAEVNKIRKRQRRSEQVRATV